MQEVRNELRDITAKLDEASARCPERQASHELPSFAEYVGWSLRFEPTALGSNARGVGSKSGAQGPGGGDLHLCVLFAPVRFFLLRLTANAFPVGRNRAASVCGGEPDAMEGVLNGRMRAERGNKGGHETALEQAGRPPTSGRTLGHGIRAVLGENTCGPLRAARGTTSRCVMTGGQMRRPRWHCGRTIARQRPQDDSTSCHEAHLPSRDLRTRQGSPGPAENTVVNKKIHSARIIVIPYLTANPISCVPTYVLAFIAQRHVPLSVAKTVWRLFSQPRECECYFRRAERRT